MADEEVYSDINPVMHYRLKPSRKKTKKKKQPRAFVPHWEDLPDLVLEDIFSRLSIRDRYYASLTCWNWNRAFHSSQIWTTFVMQEKTLTRRKYNYYMGYQYILDHIRTQICLHRFGRHFRKIVIQPISNFFNLYEFMTMLSYFAEFFDDNPFRFVHTLEFTFACHVIQRGNTVTKEDVVGTGGRLLMSLKRLMGNLPGLRCLVLNDLLLESYEAIMLLDDVVENCCQSLRTLRLINCSRGLCPILHVGILFNLKELYISPQQLSDDVVQLLGFTSLRHVHIIQTPYTDQASPVSPAAWAECTKNAPNLKINLQVEGNVQQSIMWQEKAPVASITYDTSYVRVWNSVILMAVDLYRDKLRSLAYLGLPKFYMPSSFHDRADSPLVYLCRQCPNLHTLVLRERISTSTVLLIVYYAKSLRRLIIRKNAIIKRADWPRNPDWSNEFYSWLCTNSRSYESLEREVSVMLGYKWTALCDITFKAYQIDYEI
ncbi:hypothetical protein CHUAL_006425 [Chamberlinius hualienensis]